MKYKIHFGAGIAFFILLIFYWFYIYRNYNWNIQTVNGLHSLSVVGVGYHNDKLHAVVYSLFYILFYQNVMPRMNVQTLVRETRKTHLKYMILANIKEAAFFTTIFTVVFVLCTMLITPMELLVESGYFIGVGLYWLSLWLWYAFIVAVYTLVYFVVMSNTKALVISYIGNIFILVLAMKRIIPFPIKDIGALGELLETGVLSVSSYALNTFKNILWIAIIYMISYKIFKIRDLITDEI